MRDVVKPETVGLCSDRLARIGHWMQGYVDDGRLVGALVAVARRGQLAYLDTAGMADAKAKKPMAPDTVFRIYSMTKPIVAACLMTFYEEARFQLDDPVGKFIPALADMKVHIGGDGPVALVPAARPITVRHLLTHSSGLVYGHAAPPAIAAAYEAQCIDYRASAGPDTLEQVIDRLGEVPLACHPGDAWNYSVSIDVLGRLIEVLADQPLDQVLRERIFEPLGMSETGFTVRAEARARFAACYEPTAKGRTRLYDAAEGSRFTKPAVLFSGGGGLVSTFADYDAFCQMLANKGELAGQRILGRRTVEYMAVNHLPGDLASMGQPVFSETSYEGIGYGLGMAVVLDPAVAQMMTSVGEYHWGGLASTAFWIDPVEEMQVIFLTQLIPSSTYPIRRELRVLASQALID